MNFDEYQTRAHALAVYPAEHKIMYPALKLGGEAGEVLEKIGKALRDGEPPNFKGEIAKELGDVLWYLQELGLSYGYSLNDIAVLNLAKLESRKARGVLQGSGDNR